MQQASSSTSATNFNGETGVESSHVRLIRWWTIFESSASQNFFGSVCYLLFRPYNQQKIQFGFVECVFILAIPFSGMHAV
jgi:hypothetical protein